MAKKIMFLFVIPLYLMHFFGLILTPSSIALIIVMVLTIVNWRQTPYNKTLIFYLLFVTCSIFSSYLNRGQGILYTTLASTNLLSIFYFFTIANKCSQKELEKSMYWLSISYCIIYLLQFVLLKYGIQICKVVVSSEINNNRFRLPGSGWASLACFYAMSKMLVNKQYKLRYIVLFALGMLVIIFMAFRSLTVLLLLFLLFLMFRIKGMSFKSIRYVVALAVLFVGLSFIPFVNEYITYMVDKQKEGSETFNDESYIRFASFQYYVNNYFNNIGEVIFGTGIPYGEKGSSYARLHTQLRDYGLFYVDWGLVGLAWVVGIFTVLTMFYYSIKTYILKVPKEFYYLGVWMIFFLFSSILTMEFFRDGNFIVQAFVLALVYKCNLNYKYEENRNSNLLQSR